MTSPGVLFTQVLVAHRLSLWYYYRNSKTDELMKEPKMTYAAPLAVLKTDTTMSPKNVKANEFFEPGLVAYVMRSRYNGVVRMITSWGHLGEGMEIGDMVTLVGDQTGRNIGVHEIMGIIDFTTGAKYIAKKTSWDAFKKSYKHYVVK